MDSLGEGFRERYVSAVTAGRRFRIGRLYLKGTDPKIDQAIDAALTQANFIVVPLAQDFKDSWDQAEKDATTVAEAGAWLTDGKFLSKPEVGGKVKGAIALGEIQYTTNHQKALSRQPPWPHALRQPLPPVAFITL